MATTAASTAKDPTTTNEGTKIFRFSFVARSTTLSISAVVSSRVEGEGVVMGVEEDVVIVGVEADGSSPPAQARDFMYYWMRLNFSN